MLLTHLVSPSKPWTTLQWNVYRSHAQKSVSKRKQRAKRWKSHSKQNKLLMGIQNLSFHHYWGIYHPVNSLSSQKSTECFYWTLCVIENRTGLLPALYVLVQWPGQWVSRGEILWVHLINISFLSLINLLRIAVVRFKSGIFYTTVLLEYYMKKFFYEFILF